MKTLRWARTTALALIALIVLVTTSASLAESYKALFDWAGHHMVGGNWAYGWPLMVDSFIVVGELLLFVATFDRWADEDRRFGWVLVGLGLGVSVASNVGHVGTHATLPDRLTAAVPPVAAWLIMWASIRAFKLIIDARDGLEDTMDELEDTMDELEDGVPRTEGPNLKLAAEAFAEDIEVGQVPGLNRIRKVMRVGHSNAPKIQDHLRSLVNTP